MIKINNFKNLNLKLNFFINHFKKINFLYLINHFNSFCVYSFKLSFYSLENKYKKNIHCFFIIKTLSL